MELDEYDFIDKIASKLKYKDASMKNAMAIELNELAKIIIELKKQEYENCNNIH